MASGRDFRSIATLPERDQRAVVRLIHSLVAASAIRKNGADGVRNGS